METVMPMENPVSSKNNLQVLFLALGIGIVLILILANRLLDLKNNTSNGSVKAVSTIQGVGGITWSVPTIDGGTYDFAEHKGKPTVLFLSSSWCKECRGEVAKLARVYNTYKNKGLEIVALDIYPQEGPEPWRQFKDDGAGGETVNYVWAMDTNNQIARLLNVQYLDTKIFINSQGKEVARTLGIRPYEEIEAHVKETLQ